MNHTTATRAAVRWTRRWVVMSAATLALMFGGTTAQAQGDSADLSVVVGHATASPVNPSVVTTFWNVTNNGPATATDVVLVVTLPDGTSLTSAFVQAGIEACTFDASSLQVSCAIGTLDSNVSSSATVAFANTGNPAGAVLSVQAQLDSTTPDPSTSDNTASASITLQGGPLPTAPDGPSANLGLAPTDPAPSADGSSSVGFLAWTLFNAGPDAAEGVTVEFTLPDGVTYISADVAAATPPCPYDPDTRGATCTLPDTFGSGSTTSASVRFSLEGVAAGTPITVVATVRADTVDPDPTDNVRSNTLTGAQVPATTVGPTTDAIPATGLPGPTIAIVATLVLAAGIATVGAARRTRT